MASLAAHCCSGRLDVSDVLVMPRLILEPAMTTHRRTASEPGRISARRACAQQRAELSDAARVAWMLTALQAHQKGLARGTAARMADRDAGVSTEARQAFAA